MRACHGDVTSVSGNDINGCTQTTFTTTGRAVRGLNFGMRMVACMPHVPSARGAALCWGLEQYDRDAYGLRS